VSDELGLLVLAAIFVFGVAFFALLLIVVLPGIAVADERLEAFLQRYRGRRDAEPEPDQAGD